MKIKVLFFAELRELTRKSQMNLEVKDGERVFHLLDMLKGDFPDLLSRPLMTAVNTEYVGRDHILKEGDEVALIPPVSGG